VVASTNGPPVKKLAWLSPAAREADAIVDLDEIAARIAGGADSAGLTSGVDRMPNP